MFLLCFVFAFGGCFIVGIAVGIAISGAVYLYIGWRHLHPGVYLWKDIGEYTYIISLLP